MKEFLKLLGITDDVIEKICKEIDTKYTAVENLTKEREVTKSLAAQLKEHDQQLKDLSAKAAGNEDLQRQIKELQEKNKADADAHDAQIRTITLNPAVDAALSAEKVKNLKAVRALLDNDVIKLTTDGTITGLTEQLTKLKESDGYLFDSEPNPQTTGWLITISRRASITFV